MDKEHRRPLLGAMILSACLIADGAACKSTEEPAEDFDAFPQSPVDWNVSKAATASGLDFKIIRSEVIGRGTVQMFLWVLVKTRTSDPIASPAQPFIRMETRKKSAACRSTAMEATSLSASFASPRLDFGRGPI